jgi:hypothetical protein
MELSSVGKVGAILDCSKGTSSTRSHDRVRESCSSDGVTMMYNRPFGSGTKDAQTTERRNQLSLLSKQTASNKKKIIIIKNKALTRRTA